MKKYDHRYCETILGSLIHFKSHQITFNSLTTEKMLMRENQIKDLNRGEGEAAADSSVCCIIMFTSDETKHHHQNCVIGQKRV